jgi:uncharacterized membrane protein YfcA
MTMTLLLAGGGVFAGAFGALLGLGGGILIVPVLTLGFGLPFREAVAVSLMAVITTSSASAGVYLERRVANLRLGMTLELFTAAGALLGGLAAFLLPVRVLAAGFAIMLAYVAYTMVRTRASADPAVERVTPGEESGFVASLAGPGYRVRRLPLGIGLSCFAGVVSALLGVGGGIVKVPAMHLAMGVPLRTATATSNLMIGVTASTSAILYLLRGQVDAYVAGPVVVGVFAGAAVTSRISHRVPLRGLRLLFVVVLLWVSLQMAQQALGMAGGA